VLCRLDRLERARDWLPKVHDADELRTRAFAGFTNY